MKRMFTAIITILVLMATMIPAFATNADCTHLKACVDDNFCPECGASLVDEASTITIPHKHKIKHNTPDTCSKCKAEVYECKKCAEIYEITNTRCPFCKAKRNAVTEEEKRSEYIKNTKDIFWTAIAATIVEIVLIIFTIVCRIKDDPESCILSFGSVVFGIVTIFTWIFMSPNFIVLYNARLLF